MNLVMIPLPQLVLIIFQVLGVATASPRGIGLHREFTYAPEIWNPDYLPLNESHSLTPKDPYAFSKVFGEEFILSAEQKQTVTPLPAAKPSVFTTIGAPCSWM